MTGTKKKVQISGENGTVLPANSAALNAQWKRFGKILS